MDVDEMEAGREMDAAVGKALNVKPRVTWHVFNGADIAALSFESEGDANDFLTRHPDLTDCRVGSVEWWPRYSANISEAFEVVNHLHETKGAHWDISRGDTCWSAIVVWPGADGMGTGRADTAPLAICRAVINAREVRDV